MTIRVINPPRGSESYYYIMSNVKEVTQFNIVFHDGSRTPKKICSKVEIVSLMDIPRDCDGGDQFLMSIGCSKYNKIRECEVADYGGYKKMTMDQFDALDLPKYL